MDEFNHDDFNYDAWLHFMQNQRTSVYVHDFDDPTQNMLNQMDALEDDVDADPQYESVHDLLTHIKGQTT